MRTRLALVLALVLLVPALGAVFAPAYAGGTSILAQETGGDSVDGSDDGGVGEGDEAQNPGTGEEAGEGQSDPDAETGAGEGERNEGGEDVEAGPVWTYQMSKIIIVLLVFLLLAIGGAYWRFVAQRQRAGV